jgi:hypothetical protein
MKKLVRLGVAVAICLPLLAPAWTIVSTMVAFARGTASVASPGRGYPAPESGNLDPVRRAFPSQLGCTGGFTEVLSARLARATFDALFGTFGPMPGAYLGPYPSKEAALEAIERSGVELEAVDWERGEFRLDGRPLHLDARSVGHLASSQARVALRGALIPHGPLVVCADASGFRTISLFDLGGVGWFASYRLGKIP